ncbi:MAG: isoprenyl transferase [Candidatus Omnitrophica bacterium]|nr:isoprenyl transferase [Candidatus Omnitrophota bacterium]
MLDKNNTPGHVAIIMDGNGRWAKEHGLNRTAGHREGVKRVKEIVKAAAGLGIKVITFFAFSAENWSRPKREIDILMRYLENFLGREIKDMHKNNIQFRVIGRGDRLPERLQKKIKAAEQKTRNNTGLTVVLALNYGARQEIVEAAKRFAESVLRKDNEVRDLDINLFSGYLYTARLADPDLLIRTSGEMRISNFLLWQLSYAELYFPKKFWPDFKAEDLKEAVREYQSRERRFGAL